MLKLIMKSFDMRRANVQQHYPAIYTCHTFYGSWGFIFIFTRFHHLSICRARGILTVSAEHISWRYILVLFSHSFIGLEGDLFPSDFSTNTTCAFFFPHMFDMPSPSHPPWFDHMSNNFWGIQLLELFIMHFYPVSCYFLLHGSKYNFQRPVL